MRILLCSYAFRPSIGGIETSSEVLAREFSGMGHDVRVATCSGGGEESEQFYKVIREPSLLELFSHYRWAELVLHNNLSLRLLWPNLLTKKLCFVITQTWLSGVRNEESPMSRMKRCVLKRCHNVGISNAIAAHVKHPSVIVRNPYDDATFFCDSSSRKTRDLLFAGRLVSDKGLFTLLHTLKKLTGENLYPSLTVAGDGPERLASEALVRELGLDAQITFTGALKARELAQLMNQHRILVVPSRWDEPFGIVAVEGIACGCVVVGSRSGGLPEAIGPCGVTFENGSADDLADRLIALLNSNSRIDELRASSAHHLEQFKASNIASKYLELFEHALR